MKRILLIDNYDSFTYNLHHYLESLGVEVTTVLNDSVDLKSLTNYQAVVLSPGPGLPENAGKLMDVLSLCDSRIPVLGVCLGMQAMAIILGGTLYNQPEVKHGKSEEILIDNGQLFVGLGDKIEVGLYHSWAVKQGSGDFDVTAHSESGVIMAIENSLRGFFGVQFHPESIMTPTGKEILSNFLLQVK